MRYSTLPLATTMFAAILLTGCVESASSVQVNNRQTAQTNSTSTTSPFSTPSTTGGDSHDHEGETNVKRITVEEAKAAVDAGKAVIIDVRGEDAYKVKHIKGSISMPDVSGGSGKLPKDKQIIAYCS